MGNALIFRVGNHDEKKIYVRTDYIINMPLAKHRDAIPVELGIKITIHQRQ